MKIEEKDYLEAKQIIKLYEEQCAEEFREKMKAREERYKGCDHEYRYTGSKWRSVSEQACIYCGHTIN